MTLRRAIRAALAIAPAMLMAQDVIAVPPMSGGETTRMELNKRGGNRDAFSFPATNLSLTRRDGFFVGNSFFQNAWVSAPASTKARDGLGPLFNANACQTCHIRDGRGSPPRANEKSMISMLLRVSIASDGSDAHQQMMVERGVVPHPAYGDQIQNRALPDVSPEAEVLIDWKTIEGQYPDGTSYKLRAPVYRFESAAYGDIDERLLRSGRVAPAMIGVGLLDTIPEEALRANEDPQDKDGDGISGRLNMVRDHLKDETVPGRFGWKAEQPNVHQQVASAFAGDIGISSSLFPDQLCTSVQTDCRDQPTGGDPEVSDEILDFVTFYSKTIAVPARRGHDNPVILEGEALFRQLECNACHVETFKTGVDPEFPELSEQVIHPYTDLLLHDMGEGLADDRPVFEANGREWRTPPLWGIGLIYNVNRHTNLLHDGRARNFEEAILWHGGEAENAKQAFMELDKEKRRKLTTFLRSL